MDKLLLDKFKKYECQITATIKTSNGSKLEHFLSECMFKNDQIVLKHGFIGEMSDARESEDRTFTIYFSQCEKEQVKDELEEAVKVGIGNGGHGPEFKL